MLERHLETGSSKCAETFAFSTQSPERFVTVGGMAGADPTEDEEPQTTVDPRHATGVQVGDNNTLIYYVYDRQTWSDRVAPPPLVDVTGVVESPYRGLNAFEERDSPFFCGRESATGEPNYGTE